MTQSPLLPPSVHLPPIRCIREQPLDGLAKLIDYLRTIYNPPVRGSRRVNRDGSIKTSRGQSQGGEDVTEQLRADEFERAYAVRWLTGLISQASLLQEPGDDYDEQGTLSSSYTPEDKVDALIRASAALIAICAGTSAARTFTRRYQFSSPLLTSDIEVQVRDVPIAVDEDTATVGTQTWGGACLLAEMMVENPGRFGLSEDVLGRAGRLRVLELGAGTGLVSLALSQYLTARSLASKRSQASVEVIASDYHPLVLDNLRYNMKTNFPDGAPASISFSACALDWSLYSPVAAPIAVPSFEEPFDLILGADIIYERTHASLIHDCVASLLRRPTTGALPRFHLVMPLRPTHTGESQTVQEVFPPTPGFDSHHVVACQKSARMDWRLCVLEQETIVCEAGEGVQAEVEYSHYVIGWV
ncbi:hypothetical protein L226DRAFT_535366 [Lentinus tigrinus ALCF2SS1-7]|uniref:S-adenosyl-L-methionine-dependent methyltransferase n=1 Tax=Lentinus tigrinus ALCF2SS1-6 TaxID=1328759 RepID=A0A5C2SE25_9APHY|nr:hypothetical protein L227DRAFT_609857 [Lentinus tigrinus ALCF2SS1-6]RPD74486.1 hypothetical protein L226DRAFT_535366 [Lentinus tigrinus ALCF2SS1-7]